ncbi:nuclease HARBI1 [Trichonephila clavata]|uniref:Nuclease HARBI1 n=1 Tax=Trichonephila clavata TaxID=2740835 RepID=A0A8X6LZC4_TRICU|nr:nuclease HARBI1 [Trichonephila clavata]
MSSSEKIGGEGKIVEVDESQFGKRKYNRRHAMEGQWVFGGVERGSGLCKNNDLNELDENDFRRRYRFYIGTIETLVELLRTMLDSATGRNHALTAAEKVLAAVRFFCVRAHLETEIPSSCHLLGDSGYPLRSYLTPFLNAVGAGQVRYNAAHARARNVIERQYGVWKKRFSCIDTPFRCSLEAAQTVIVATAVLHNLALSLGDYEDEDSLPL